MRYRLKHLEVGAFRGARNRLGVSLDKPLVVIYGPNGAGKSTLTTAIEWALFPREATLLKKHEIRERTDWEVRHVHTDDEPYVRLTLSKGSEELVVEHTGSKTKKKGKQSTDARTSLKCNYADFKGLAYIHQESIRDFLIGTAKPREEAFQRLLGAGWIQDLAEGIENAIKKLRCDEADQRVDKLNMQLDARMQEARRLLEEKENAARQDGLKEPWEEEAEMKVKEVSDAISALWGQFGIQCPDLPERRPFKDYSRRLGLVLHNIRGQGPAQTSTELSTRKTKLEGARASYKTAHDAVKSKWDELQRTDPELEINEQVSQKIASLRQQSVSLQGKLDNLSCERSVMRAALQYFKATTDARACPACLRAGIPGDVVDRLEKRLGAEATAQEKALADERNDVESQFHTLNRLAGELKHGEEQLSKQREAVEAILGRPLRDDESPLQVVDAEIGELKDKTSALSQGVQQLQNTVTGIENTAKRVDQVGEILSLQQRVDSLGQFCQRSEWQTMTEAQMALSRAEQAFKLCCDALKQVAAKLAQHNLHRAREPITTIYRQLTRRADFPDITIDPQRKYAIDVSSGSASQRITAVLNQTDLDSLAIAVVAGMSTMFPEVHDLDFLILDDPSQGMDPDVTSRLADMISSLSEKIQVVVATPDPSLFQKLKKSGRLKRLIELKARDPESSAPFVQLQSVRDD